MSPEKRLLIPFLALVAGFAAEPLAADDKDDAEPEKEHPFAVRLVDPAGMPVVAAFAGVTAYFGDEGRTLPGCAMN